MRSSASSSLGHFFRSLFPAGAAIAAVVVLGAGAPACGLSSSVDDVLQPEEGEAGSGGSPTGSATTGSGGAGGSGGASTSSGGGGVMGPEACLDGADNDGDGMVDCADTDCGAGYECVDTAPSGWDGPYRVTKSELPVEEPVECDGGTAPETFFSDAAGAAACSACSCGDLTGASCSPPSITCWPGSTTCMGNGQDLTAALQNAQCAKPGNQLGATTQVSCMLTALAAVTQSGSCAPSDVDFPNKAAFGSEVAACPLPTSGGGCGGGQACVPRGSDPAQSVCVRQDGESKQCPSGFSESVQAYVGGDDTRGCSECQCGDAATTCSGGSYMFYDLNMCMMGGGGDPPIAIDSSACKNTTPALDGQPTTTTSWSIGKVAATPSGTCAPSGGEPTGQLNLQGSVTFCCK